MSPDTLNVAFRRLPLEGIAHFTPHDMRRTARTHLAALGVTAFVAERALNHKLKGSEGIYDRHDYFDERREALQRWSDMLGALSRGAPVQFPSDRSKAAAAQRAGLASWQPSVPHSFMTMQAANE